MKHVLTTHSLHKQYGTITAVDNLNLSVPKGTVYGILGPNGSGKTTTLGMILGVTRPTAGNYQWFESPNPEQAKLKMGALLETPNFYPYMNGLDNLKLIAKIKEVKNPDYQSILKTINLQQRARSKFKTYSLGMKQRLAIGAALLSDPEVLVLDEPTNGLDPNGLAEVRNLIIEIARQGITVIMASHLLYEIEKVCSHVAVLRNGKLLFDGPADELTGHEGMIEIHSEDMEKLEKALQSFPPMAKINHNEGSLQLMLKEKTDPARLNQFLTEQGIYADHLVYKKASLEKQFLNLIKD